MSLALILTGCGGDDGSTPLVDTDEDSIPFVDTGEDKGSESTTGNTENGSTGMTSSSTASPGFYDTAIDIEDGGNATGQTLLSPSDSFVTLAGNGDATFGSLTFIDDTDVEGTGTNFFVADNVQVSEGTISGAVQGEGAIELNVSAPTADYRSVVKLTRRNDISSTVPDDIAGTYFMADNQNNISITIAEDLTVTGSDSTGCVFDGRIRAPNPDFNVFEVGYTAEQCGSNNNFPSEESRNGSFTGLGYFSLENGALNLLATNQSTFINFIGI
jgi:hypothetical protein